MPRINKSQYAVLTFLSKREGLSGYDLLKIFAKVSDFYWSESNAQVYPILKKMEHAGLVTSSIDEKSGARKRRIYAITEQGFDLLREWLDLPVEPSPLREELLLKLSAGEHIEPHILKQHLLDYQRHIEKKLCLLNKIKKHIEEVHAGRADQPYLTLINRHSELELEAKLKWCNEALASDLLEN